MLRSHHISLVALLLLTACPSGVTVPVEGEDMAELDQGEDVTEEMGSRDEQCPEGPDWRECDDGDPRTYNDYCRDGGCSGNPCPCEGLSFCCADGCSPSNAGKPCDRADGTTSICGAGKCGL